MSPIYLSTHQFGTYSIHFSVFYCLEHGHPNPSNLITFDLLFFLRVYLSTYRSINKEPMQPKLIFCFEYGHPNLTLKTLSFIQFINLSTQRPFNELPIPSTFLLFFPSSMVTLITDTHFPCNSMQFPQLMLNYT